MVAVTVRHILLLIKGEPQGISVRTIGYPHEGQGGTDPRHSGIDPQAVSQASGGGSHHGVMGDRDPRR